VKNQLYYGDNLVVLREHIKDESVEMEYLAFVWRGRPRPREAWISICQVGTVGPGCPAEIRRRDTVRMCSLH